jgi:1-acyl-sn-glycerol-3-phosphate acyltransferase
VRFTWRLLWYLANILAWLVLGLEVRGREKVPRRGGVLLAANHLSYLDGPLLGTAAPRELFFLAKEGLFEQSRFFAWLISSFNAIPIKVRSGGHGALREASRLLREGRGVVIFPEGTRSLSGVLLPAKSGVGLLAMKNGVPVVPVRIEGSAASLGRLILRRDRLRVTFGDPLSPVEGGASSNRELCDALSREVLEEIRFLGNTT